MTKKINQEFLAQRTLGQGTATNFWEGTKIIMVKYGFTILNHHRKFFKTFSTP